MDKLGQEWVSAAVDGEVDSNTFADLSSDTASQKKWQDYHLIGDAIRGELPATLHLDLSKNIALALENEKPHQAPLGKLDKQTDDKAVVKSAKVVPLFKQIGQYAIAASVAMLAVLGVQNYNQQADNNDSPLPVLNTRPLVGNVSPVSLQTGPVKVYSQADGSNEQLVEQQSLRLNAYIQDHMLQQRFNSDVIKTDASSNSFNQ